LGSRADMTPLISDLGWSALAGIAWLTIREVLRTATLILILRRALEGSDSVDRAAVIRAVAALVRRSRGVPDQWG
jgi:hypothetical protein